MSKVTVSSTAEEVCALARLTLEVLQLLVALLLALAILIDAKSCSAGFQVHDDGGCPAFALLADAFPCSVAHLCKQLVTPVSRSITKSHFAPALLDH